MSALKWFLVVVIVLGVALFLYGANYYDPVVGWVGVSFIAAGVVGFLVLYAYSELKKTDQVQKP